jgi:hypothetical protein
MPKKKPPVVTANPFGEPGFEVRSPCGRAWFVPLEQVREDYAEFLKQVDGLDDEAARSEVARNESFVPTWFYEQFAWADILARGKLVKEATAEDIVRALDFLRANSDIGPLDDVVDHEIPEK